MHLFHRITTRRVLLAAVAPAALAASAVLPAAADAGTIVLSPSAGSGHLDYADNGGRLANNTNDVRVSVVGSELRVKDLSQGMALAAPDNPCVIVAPNEASCPLSQVRSISAFLGPGNDQWRSDAALPTNVFGGDGADHVRRGQHPGGSSLQVRGDAGRDTMDYELAGGGVTVTKDGLFNDGRPAIDGDNIHPDVEILRGSAGNDSLNGSNDPDAIEFFIGSFGDDVLSGNGGRDIFSTGSSDDGADRILGGDGEDEVSYELRSRPVTANLSDGGADDGEAGEGDEIRQVERVRGGSASDTLRVNPSGTTPATLLGLGGADTLDGARGGDTIDGGAGTDTIRAGAGKDVIQVRDGEADTVSCGTEFDTADVENGLDLFSGCEKFERLGALKLTRAAQASAAAPARLALSWRHPESWRKLRAVHVRLKDDGATVGEVKIAPRDARMTADGAVRLIRKESRMTRKGKMASARLALRIDPSLAGRKLGIEVEAVDTRGRRQLETSAGTLRLAG